MRKGYTLVQILIVVVIMPVLILVLDGLFKTLIKDVPRSYKVVQVNTSLLNMLKVIQKDVDSAKSLPQKYNEYTNDDKILLIDLPEGMICYQIKDDKIFRYNLTKNEKSNAAQSKYWSIPHARVEWKTWRKDTRGYAVEIQTHIEHEVHGHLEKKMANSHLYFVDAL